jgi:hypothetical protein
VEVLGSYDPHSKKSVLKTDKIKDWMSKGAQASDSVYNLLVREGVVEGKKRAVKMEKPKTPEAPAEEVKAEDTKPGETKSEEVKAEEAKPEEPARNASQSDAGGAKTEEVVAA